MRRLLIPLTILAAVATFTGAPSLASAASCSVSGQGGEKTPIIADDNSINEAASQGYKCTVQWAADTQPQYESGGTWHYCMECSPDFHPETPDTFAPANTVQNWGLHAWFATATGDTPTCAFNWRIQVNFFGTNHFVFQSDVSPEAHKTC